MAQLNAYLFFNGNAKEAMEFYKEVFGGELELLTIGDSQMAEQMGPEMKNKIMHSVLKNQKVVLMGSDMMDSDTREKGNILSLCLVCDNKEEIEGLFKKLADGGVIGHDLKEEFFGTFGDLTDKFGIPWMLQKGETSTEK